MIVLLYGEDLNYYICVQLGFWEYYCTIVSNISQFVYTDDIVEISLSTYGKLLSTYGGKGFPELLEFRMTTRSKRKVSIVTYFKSFSSTLFIKFPKFIFFIRIFTKPRSFMVFNYFLFLIEMVTLNQFFGYSKNYDISD